MTWFRVDDKLADNHKVRRAGTAAMGLWLLAGSWSAAQLTDGWVPREVALRYGTEKQAERLVRAGLWHVETRSGEPGWVFHEWAEHQPTKEQVKRRRASDAERAKRGRAKTGRDTPESPGASRGKTEQDRESKNQPKNHETAGQESASRRDSARTNGVSHGAPDPTRPIYPLPPNGGRGGAGETPDGATPSEPKKGKQGTRIPDGFEATPEMIAWARSNTPDVGQAETDKFIDYWRGKSGQAARKVDWIATWRNWMRRAQEDHDNRKQRPGPKGPRNADHEISEFLTRWSSDNGATGTDGPQTTLYALPGGDDV